MRSVGNNLAEFIALSDELKIDESGVRKILDALDFRKLNAVLISHKFFRKIFIDKWLNHAQKVLKISIKTELVKEEIVPFMKESGVLCFSKRDIARKEKTFVLLAHEIAHFIIMKDERYDEIRRFDIEYKENGFERSNMLSPIEYCANLVTLMILSRCENAMKSKKNRRIIQELVCSLKKQLT
jgi:hypothetical protein